MPQGHTSLGVIHLWGIPFYHFLPLLLPPFLSLPTIRVGTILEFSRIVHSWFILEFKKRIPIHCIDSFFLHHFVINLIKKTKNLLNRQGKHAFYVKIWHNFLNIVTLKESILLKKWIADSWFTQKSRFCIENRFKESWMCLPYAQ